MIEKTKAQWGHIRRTYGITPEQYNALDLGYCPICLRAWSSSVQPVVDHRHSNISRQVVGYVRGLLCRYCNKFRVGRLDDAELVARIASYLRDAPTHLIVPERKKKRKKNGTQPSRHCRSARTPRL